MESLKTDTKARLDIQILKGKKNNTTFLHRLGEISLFCFFLNIETSNRTIEK